VRVAVARDARALGFDGSGRRVPDAYEVLDLREALERVYTTDAHFVTYVVEGATRQPRLNKSGLPYFDRPVFTTTFVCDVDNPGHAEWDDALRAQAARDWEGIPSLSTCGLYHTLHGRRFVQPIAEPIPVAGAELYLRRWLLGLESAGIAVDWTCRDWTRHFRLPHVRRSGGTFRSPVVALDRMRPLALEPLPEPLAVSAPAASAARRATVPLAWTHDLPPNWEERAIVLAKAIRASVTERWHEMYLALGGALLARQCPAERLPAVIAWIAAAAGSEKPWSHESSARGTARRYLEGLEVTGYRTLRRSWPTVADAVDAATATRREARLREQAQSAPPAPSLAESMAALTAAIREAPDGLTVISAECGMGKTNAAMGVAAERAAKPYASPSAKGQRAPPQSKTAISVDKNALAVQIALDLRARGAPVRRIFGPLSVLREDGSHECRFADVAEPLVQGGQPMQWVLCKECEHRDVCAARDGIDGPADARVAVGPHALLSELDASAGATGLLVIDEPPPALETVALSRRDFADSRDRLDAFEDNYAAAMRPIVEAFDRWMDIAQSDTPTEPLLALRQALPGADLGALVDGAKSALAEERLSRAPPIRRSDIYAAKQSLSYAKQLGNASRVLGTLHRVLTTSDRVAVRVEQRGDAHALVVTMPCAGLTRALKRQGSVVVTDANAELHLPVFEKIVGYPPRFHRFAAADGAPVARTLLRCRSATRRGWFAHGALALDAVLPILRAALEWAREDAACRRLGLITMRLLRLHLEAAWRPDDTPPEELPKSDIEAARENLGPILRGWKGEIVFGHYGAVRGLNTMADADALITLGDPWPNVGDARNDAAFLGLAPSWEQRLEAMCRAELEQAHGRIRAVHRTRPARALHVGSVLPSGYGWTAGGVEIRTMKPGPSRKESAMAVAELLERVHALGGMRSAARAVGCSPSTVVTYCAGTRSVPPEVAHTLRSLVSQAVGDREIPDKEIS
jgi:hypothetical protein